MYKNIFIVCNYNAQYGGNFLASLLRLCTFLKLDHYYFVFPEGAKNKKWIAMIPENIHLLFCDFSFWSLERTLSANLQPKSMIYTHFLGAKEIVAIRFAAHKFKNKIVYHMHNRYGSKDNAIRKALKNFIYHGVDFIGVSKGVYADLCNVFPQEKCYCVPNAISLSRFPEIQPDLIHREQQALILGTNFDRKGVDLALEAVSFIQKDFPMKLVVVTHDPDACGRAIERCMGIIPEFVTILPPSENIGEIYRQSLIFLSPSRAEAFGYAVAEAAYCGCRVVASDIEGQNTMKDIPGITWVEPNNAEALYNGICAALDRSDRCSADTQKFIRDHYSLDAWCKQMLTVFNSITDKDRE